DSTNGWALQTDCTTACSSQPASGDDKLHRIRQNPFNDAEFMGIFVDTGSDLWAKKLTFDGTNLTWSNADGGVALEATMSSITGFSADFAFNRYIPTPTFTQSAYRLFNNLDSTDVGTALALQDTAATLGSTGAVFRLRMLLHINTNQLAASGQAFKLQFAQMSGACDTGFAGETYADVTAATVIAYKDNATPSDGAALTANADDPTHGADTIVNQTYEELNNFTNSVAAIPSGQDGKWDFALYDNGATANTAYCLRAVLSTGTVINTYTVIPQITTAAAATVSCSAAPTTTNFGTLTTSSVHTSANNVTATTSCTYAGGCILYVNDAGAGSGQPSLYKSTPITDLIDSSTATLSAGAEGYGIQGATTANGSGATLTLSSTYNKTGNDVGGLTTSTQNLASANSTFTDREVVITHKATMSPINIYGNYSDSITYSCVGN
ncbi:MAG: hypothetical protein Q8L68_00635, partial [Methylococcales bacterium]|nr:hypothetical protein [Methylococcales bacterium]